MNTQSFLFPLGTGIQMLGLALMVGGMLSIGAFSAPVIFKHVARPEAGEILTTIFRRYDNVLIAALIMVVVGEVLRIMASSGFQWQAPLPLARYAVMTAMIVMMLFSIFKINADIEAMHKAGIGYGATAEGQKFLQTHELSEKLYKTEMFGAVILILLTPFL